MGPPIDGRPYWLLRRADGGGCEPGANDLRVELRAAVDGTESPRLLAIEGRVIPPVRGGAIDMREDPEAIDMREAGPGPVLGRFIDVGMLLMVWVG